MELKLAEMLRKEKEKMFRSSMHTEIYVYIFELQKAFETVKVSGFWCMREGTRHKNCETKEALEGKKKIFFLFAKFKYIPKTVNKNSE